MPLKSCYAQHTTVDANGIPRGFSTPSRKVELYSEEFLEHGYAPLPEYQEPLIGPLTRPNLAARFPLILTSTKHTLFCESQHRALPSLRKHAPHPEVEMHPETAEARGIAAGDWVAIETPEGSVRARARLDTSSIPALYAVSTDGGRPARSLARRATTPSGPMGPT